jgi:hypothetical protein
MASLDGKHILLIIGGGIAAYKALELIRRLKERGAGVRAVLTKSAHHFVTPLSVAALAGERVFSDLFDLDDEHEIGHIRLSREADLVVVAPATADLLAKLAHGLADDLASAVLLATDKPVLVAPAMNPACGSTRPPGAMSANSAVTVCFLWAPKRARWRSAAKQARPAFGADDHRGRYRAAFFGRLRGRLPASARS